MSGFNLSDIYPGYKGMTLAEESAVDANAQQVLAQDGDGQILRASKSKQYNITSALVVLVLIIIALQLTK